MSLDLHEFIWPVIFIQIVKSVIFIFQICLFDQNTRIDVYTFE